eukprot:TRINITY_DN1583_c0_g1_i3.p1 TRINITY_DN1583_c0_g1~~TRINITY_DN1583_c0_g1_i3.p1  ORF type:complete len:1977 (-),score=328.37 TRINITY_DN1583_c0_g1_i3:362-5602(-)
MSPNEVGVEAIVKAQIARILPLLLDAHVAGDIKGDIRIGTACSGTDSPILGTILDMEVLQAAGYGDLLKFKHVMSCEIEPFKQAFLARNYPGAELLPDIRELVPKDGTRHTQNVIGAKVEVPHCDIFVAGTVCKDFSMRKTHRLDLEDEGMSGQTFFAAVDYIFDRKIPFSIFENVVNSPWDKMKEYITGVVHVASLSQDLSAGKKIQSKNTGGKDDTDLVFSYRSNGTLEVETVPRTAGVRLGAVLLKVQTADGRERSVQLPMSLKLKVGEKITFQDLQPMLAIQKNDFLVFDTSELGFHAHKVKVDSKKYGLPQTRERGYMFVWHESEGGTDLGHSWEELVRLLENPVRYGLSEFLLADDDERVRRFREVLRGPLGRRAEEETANLDGGDWWSSRSKGLARAKEYHKKYGHSPEVRSLTGWGKNGHFKCNPVMWPELLAVFDSRQRDLMESFVAECAGEERSRDPAHSNYVWDISQSVGIASPYSKPGVTGCLTPGGWFFMPNRGRVIMGYEKLILQGIPVNRLALGMESEVQLSDLAGNAMSLPVVNSCVLAALTVKALARAKARDASYSLEHLKRQPSLETSSSRGVVATWPPGSLQPQQHAGSAFHAMAKLCAAAESSSILCTCETSGGISSAEILQCAGCGLSVCRSCAVRVATESHESQLRAYGHSRPSTPNDFLQQLRCVAPQRLLLPSRSLSLLQGSSVSTDLAFCLVQVKRNWGSWMLRYVPEAERQPSAELKMFVGSSSMTDGFKGLRCELRLFTGDSQSKVPVKARLVLQDGQVQAVWEIQGDPVPMEIELHPSDMGPSYRAELGMKDYLHEKWPNQFQIRTASSALNGAYTRMKCRGTTNQSALWRREGGPFLYLRPDIDRICPDVPTLAKAPSYTEADVFTLATFDSDWTPASRTRSVKGQAVTWKEAPVTFHVLPEIVLTKPCNLDFALTSSQPLDRVAVAQLTMPSVIMSSLIPDCGTKWLELAFEGAKCQILRQFINGVSGTLLRDGIQDKFQNWQLLDGSDWGACKLSAPKAPKACWNSDGTRRYEHEESVEFERKMRQRPAAWVVRVRSSPASAEAAFEVHPTAIAHRAASALPNDGGSVRCDWRVVEPSQDLSQTTWNFQVPNSDAFKEAETPEAMAAQGKQLYPRQARALHRMLDIEAGRVSFEQEERSEHQLPGVGWLLEARARAVRTLPGGVLADEMGGGKTITTLALVASTEKQALTVSRDSTVALNQRSQATLILCPPHLVAQWDAERVNFTGQRLSTLVISSAKDLAKLTVDMLRKADLVIASFDLLADDSYIGNLKEKSACDELQSFPGGQAGHKEPDQLRGVWLPGHPAAPYAQAKGKQLQRDQAAFFSECYRRAIVKLRVQCLNSDEMNPPLEYFEWHRIVMDEVHEAFGNASGKDRSQRAARELLGVSHAEPHLRPLRAAIGFWGLTGTPMLNDEQRVTEMASLCGGVYVMAARTHWRTLERASLRDQFLLAQEPLPSTQYRQESRRHAQSYVQAAFQRNRVDKFSLTKLTTHTVSARLSNAEAKEYMKILSESHGGQFHGVYDAPKQSVSYQIWQKLREESARAEARAEALRRIIIDVQRSDGPTTKVVVFADFGAQLQAARSALMLMRKGPQDHAIFVEPCEDKALQAFMQQDVTEADRLRPRVLLLSFEQAAGLNLQHSCFHAVLFAPLSSDDEIHDCAREQQAIGRIHRPGQDKDVNVWRIILQGPDEQPTIDTQILAQNTKPARIAAATSN